MGTLTLAEIKEEIRASLAGRTDLDARLTRIINLSQMRIARKKRWEELEATESVVISDTGDFDVDRFLAIPNSGDVRDVYSVICIQAGSRWRKLRRVDQRLWDRQIVAADEYDRRMPEWYTRWGNQFEVFPVQDQDYTIRFRYCKWPTAFAADEDVVSELEQKDDMLITCSLAYIYNSLKKMDEAARFWGIYIDMLQTAMDEESEVPDLDMLPRAGVRDGGARKSYVNDPFQRGIPT